MIRVLAGALLALAPVAARAMHAPGPTPPGPSAAAADECVVLLHGMAPFGTRIE